ncbi:MAG TPA: cytochrome c3 family protein [Vicinamibacterales bacterium]|nr:cytochrome c3 family protein [Vicinamibacterales bacterium]
MRRLAVFSVFLLIIAAPVIAQDNFHYATNMNCSDCHSMHASAHNNLTDGTAITLPRTPPSQNQAGINPYYPAPNPGTGRESLLKADDVCESCHKDQTFAPDEYGDNVNGYVRSAGGIRTGSVGGGHLIGTTNRPPGYNPGSNGGFDPFPAGTALECVTCHSPHGAKNFRNLVGHNYSALPGYSSAALSISETKGAFNAATDVTILGGDSYVFGSGNLATYYGRDSIVYAKAASPIVWNGVTSSNHYDQFCGTCHYNFHGSGPAGVHGAGGDATVSDGTAFVKHPTGVVTIGSFSNATLASNLKVYQAAAAANAATDSPGCISCHKAHGNNNPFGLIFPTSKGKDKTEEGDGGAYRNLCQACHGMGGGSNP